MLSHWFVCFWDTDEYSEVDLEWRTPQWEFRFCGHQFVSSPGWRTGFGQRSYIIFADYLLHVAHAIDLNEFCWQNLDFKQNRSRAVRAAGRMSAGPVELSNIYFASRIRLPVSLLQIQRLSELYVAWNCTVSFTRFQKSVESCKKYIHLHTVQLKLSTNPCFISPSRNELWKWEQNF